jgi:lichenan operon transcriptional antiterminator
VPNDPGERLVAWLSAHPGAWSSSELAEALGITSRSIRNHITRANSGPAGTLVERTAKGYRLCRPGGASPGRSELEHRTDVGARTHTRASHDRTYALLRRLMIAADPVSVHDLAVDAAVSESTIDNDMRQIAGLAGRHQVALRRSGDLISLHGSEADRRQLMRSALVEASNPAALLETSRLQAAYESYDIADIRSHVGQAIATHGLHCNDYTLNPLVLELVIAVDRLSDDHTLADARPTSGSSSSATADPRLIGSARDIADYFAGAYGVTFNAAELEGVALLVASRTTLLRGTTDRDVVVGHVGADLVTLVSRILSELSDVYLIDLVDDAFVASLALHTHNLLVRASSGRPHKNPFAEVIRTEHPLVHELAVHFSRELERATGATVDTDEVGFIAFHLGGAVERRRRERSGAFGAGQVSLSLVIPEYGDVGRALAQRIGERLGGRAIIDQVVETGEPAASQLTGELVVSPLPVPGLHPGRLVRISPLLSQQDLDLIDARVRSHQRSHGWLRLVGQLHALFSPALFFRSPDTRHQHDTLQLLASALQKSDAVPEDFLQQVLEREQLSPTAFNDIVAVPHTLGLLAERTNVAVAAYDDPIDWEGTPVRLVLLIAFGAADRHLFRDTFDQLIAVLAEPRNVNRLVSRGVDYTSYLKVLGELIQDADG